MVHCQYTSTEIFLSQQSSSPSLYRWNTNPKDASSGLTDLAALPQFSGVISEWTCTLTSAQPVVIFPPFRAYCTAYTSHWLLQALPQMPTQSFRSKLCFCTRHCSSLPFFYSPILCFNSSQSADFSHMALKAPPSLSNRALGESYSTMLP